MKILLITGGIDSKIDRHDSLISAHNIEQELIKNGHQIRILDFKNKYQPIKKAAEGIDVIFPMMHGEKAEGGELHKYLSGFDIPIVGTRNHDGLKKSWYKLSFKKFCNKNNILTPDWIPIKNTQDVIKFGFPSVVKASTGGASVEVFPFHDEKEFLKSKINIADLKDPYVERHIQGTEVTVGVLKGEALPVIEIIPPAGSWFNYENKYSGATREIPFAPSLSPLMQKELQNITLKIHNCFKLGTYSRIDFIVKNNQLFVLEINTIPGMTSGSLFPKAALAAGIDFGQLLEILITNAQ